MSDMIAILSISRLKGSVELFAELESRFLELSVINARDRAPPTPPMLCSCRCRRLSETCDCAILGAVNPNAIDSRALTVGRLTSTAKCDNARKC